MAYDDDKENPTPGRRDEPERPSSWGMYQPTQWDWGMFIGTIGFFFTLLFLFIRFLPMISIFEMRTILPEAEVEE